MFYIDLLKLFPKFVRVLLHPVQITRHTKINYLFRRSRMSLYYKDFHASPHSTGQSEHSSLLSVMRWSTILLAVAVASDPLSQVVIVVQESSRVGRVGSQRSRLLRPQAHALVGHGSGGSVGHDGRL